MFDLYSVQKNNQKGIVNKKWFLSKNSIVY